jgi:hypothetical protein
MFWPKECNSVASDELRIILEDVKEKFDTVIAGYNLFSEKIDRLAKHNEAEHEQLQTEIMGLRRDLNEHRSNTELHGGSASSGDQRAAPAHDRQDD